MRERYFRFKQFGVKHSRSAMKVGVDAVMLGAWADVESASSILDAGCGCGLIALMLAQRNPTARIDGIDIDADSVAEATDNVALSPWSDRISICQTDFMNYSQESGAKYDHIVSNPPYFSAGVNDISGGRLISRHASVEGLSPVSLLSVGSQMLTVNGKISMICPPLWLDELQECAAECGLRLRRLCRVSGTSDSPVKRLLLEFGKEGSECVETDIVIEAERGVPTEEYRRLTQDFYLKF